MKQLVNIIQSKMSYPKQIPSLIYNHARIEQPTFTKYIIDTDAGGDDAHAILIAHHILNKYRKDAELIGITAVAGNTSIENVVKNVAIINSLGDLEVKPKVYKGCIHDTLQQTYRDNFFKDDGLGGGVQEVYLKKLGHSEKQLDDFYEKEHAVEFILDSVKRYGNELCIIALGPLTNIFLAMQLNPNFPEQLGGLYMMGGTYLGVGNANNAISEFNILTDVEAAVMVMKAPFKHLTILPFDTVLGFEIPKNYEEIIFKDDKRNEKSRIVHLIFKEVCQTIPYTLCDQLCVILALMPQLITHNFQRPIIICPDGFARGAMIVDWYEKIPGGRKKNVVTGIDDEQVLIIAAEANH